MGVGPLKPVLPMVMPMLRLLFLHEVVIGCAEIWVHLFQPMWARLLNDDALIFCKEHAPVSSCDPQIRRFVLSTLSPRMFAGADGFDAHSLGTYWVIRTVAPQHALQSNGQHQTRSAPVVCLPLRTLLDSGCRTRCAVFSFARFAHANTATLVAHHHCIRHRCFSWDGSALKDQPGRAGRASSERI